MKRLGRLAVPQREREQVLLGLKLQVLHVLTRQRKIPSISALRLWFMNPKLNLRRLRCGRSIHDVSLVSQR